MASARFSGYLYDLAVVKRLLISSQLTVFHQGGEVVGALVLVLEVVGVLPDVVAEDGVVAL